MKAPPPPHRRYLEMILVAAVAITGAGVWVWRSRDDPRRVATSSSVGREAGIICKAVGDQLAESTVRVPEYEQERAGRVRAVQSSAPRVAQAAVDQGRLDAAVQELLAWARSGRIPSGPRNTNEETLDLQNSESVPVLLRRWTRSDPKDAASWWHGIARFQSEDRSP